MGLVGTRHGAAGSAQYVARAIDFDGTLYGAKGSAISGTSDSKLLTWSFWVYPTNIGTEQRIFGLDGQSDFRIVLTAAGKIEIQAPASGGFSRLNVTSNTTLSNDTGYHILGSVDLDSSSNRNFIVNGTDEEGSATWTAYDNSSAMDFTTHSDTAVGADLTPSAANEFEGALADLWLAFGTRIEFDTASNVRQFYSQTGKPQYLGATGENPGVTPDVYLHLAKGAAASTWFTNKGGGGGYTIGAGSASVSAWVPGT